MKNSIVLVMTGLMAAPAAFAGNCAYQFNDIQRLLRDGVTQGARDNTQRASTVAQEAMNLERIVSTTGSSAPQFEQGINSQVSQSATENLHSREALYNVNVLLANDFKQAYQHAIDVICGGHCSPGTSDSVHADAVNQLLLIVNNALGNVEAAKLHAENSNSSLTSVSSSVTRAQQQVNQGGSSNGQLVRQAEVVSRLAQDLARASDALVGQGWGNSGGATLTNLGNGLNDFSARGCVNPAQ